MEQLYKFTGMENKSGYWVEANPYDYDSLSCSDFEQTNEKPTDENKKTLYIMPDQMSGSDYSGTCAERSNYEVFLKDFGRRKGVHRVYGGMGSYAVAIRLDVSEKEDIAEVLNGLENYGVIDEGAMTELEQKGSEDAWKDWGESDTRSKLHKELQKTFTDPEEMIEQVEDIQPYFESAREAVNEYWECETGGNMYIRLDKIVPALAELFIAWHTPLIILSSLSSRTWLNPDAKKEFEERLKLAIPYEELPTLIGTEWESKVIREEFETLLKGKMSEVASDGIQLELRF